MEQLDFVMRRASSDFLVTVGGTKPVSPTSRDVLVKPPGAAVAGNIGPIPMVTGR